MSEILEQTSPVVLHDDFDWTVDKRNVVRYTEEERVAYDTQYSSTLKTIENDEIVKGIVVALTNTDVVLNIGFKSDGLVPLSEFRDVEDLKVGDEFDVYVVNKEDRKGILQLSRKNARTMKAWEEIVDAHKTGVVVQGKIVSKTKGGLIANVFGVDTFLPGSQIDVKQIGRAHV